MLINEESLANVYEMSTCITCLGNITTSRQSYNWTLTLSSYEATVRIVRIKPTFTSWESQLDI
jgi:hypothetical protein